MESGKGIFPTTGGQGLALKAYNQRKKRSKVLSDRAKLDATMLARICRKLGSQAR